MANYYRVLLKLSGECLSGEVGTGIDPIVLKQIVTDIGKIVSAGVEVALVVGGGNLFRGSMISQVGLNRITGDQMGMLATVINALAVRDSLQQIGLEAELMSAIPMPGLIMAYNQHYALRALQQKQVVIFSAGIGSPCFTTDTAACLRAIEMNADVVLKATKVDRVYSDDPIKDTDAIPYTEITYDEIIEQKLKVMDMTAICICREYHMPIHVFNITKPGALLEVIHNRGLGTIISGEH